MNGRLIVAGEVVVESNSVLDPNTGSLVGRSAAISWLGFKRAHAEANSDKDSIAALALWGIG